jgi:hypothetical protein
MRYFARVIGVLIALALLLVVIGTVAWGGDVGEETAAGVERTDDTPLICLALVGGTALLAGGVWMRQVRRMLS